MAAPQPDAHNGRVVDASQPVPRLSGRRGRTRALAAGLAVLGTGAWLSGCAYAYDDGLPPLGQREASASAAAEASASAAAAAASAAAQRGRGWFPQDAPLDQLFEGRVLRSWARAMLPDEHGLSIGFGAAAVQPGSGAVTLHAAAPAGTATVRFVCRGPGSAHVSVRVGDAVPLALDFGCNRTHSRVITVPEAGAVEVAFAAVGDAPSNVAFRLTRP